MRLFRPMDGLPVAVAVCGLLLFWFVWTKAGRRFWWEWSKAVMLKIGEDDSLFDRRT